MSETPNIKENPFEQANGDSGKENLPFNRKKNSSRLKRVPLSDNPYSQQYGNRYTAVV